MPEAAHPMRASDAPADARKRILRACIELRPFTDLCAEMGAAGRFSFVFLLARHLAQRRRAR